MPTLDESFLELRQRLKQRNRLSDRSGDPIYYLIFPPAQMMSVKRRMRIWTVQLETQDGWKVYTVSLARKIQELFRTHRRRPVWIAYEQSHPYDFENVNKTLAAVLTEDGQVTRWVRSVLEEAAGMPNGLVMVTDIEALHPYLRIGTVEQALQGSCPVPLVILYPGTRTGRTSLRFLGVYPEDGNYRSIHIGG
jgi:hypothetical protein